MPEFFLKKKKKIEKFKALENVGANQPHTIFYCYEGWHSGAVLEWKIAELLGNKMNSDLLFWKLNSFTVYC